MFTIFNKKELGDLHVFQKNKNKKKDTTQEQKARTNQEAVNRRCPRVILKLAGGLWIEIRMEK